MAPALPSEKLYLSPRAYDYFGAEYGDMASYAARVHGRVLLGERRLSGEVYELTLAGRSLPDICNGVLTPRGGKHDHQEDGRPDAGNGSV